MPREQVCSDQLGESPFGFFAHFCLFQAILRLANAGNVPHFSCKGDLGATAKGWESLAEILASENRMGTAQDLISWEYIIRTLPWVTCTLQVLRKLFKFDM